MDFRPQAPPQPYADSDQINAAFDNMGEDDYSGYSNGEMNGMHGMNGYEDEEDDRSDASLSDRDNFKSDVQVTDYTTELPVEESEGWDYNAEKRHIRETVDLGGSYLFMWGDGSFGKLGHNSTENVIVPFIVASLQKIPVRMCALGKDHSVILATEGYMLTCGSNMYGQLGSGDTDDMRQNFVLVQGATDVMSVASGHYHSLCLTGGGKVLAWGSGSWGKLGLNIDSNVKAPRVIASIAQSKVESIACGAQHSCAITASGDVWTWGKGVRGQLGHNTIKEEYNPRICALLRKAGAERIRCGNDHTLVLLRNGQAFVMGANHCGQLGLGDNLDRAVPCPLVTLADEHIADIVAACDGSLVLTNTGKVYTFGNSANDPRCREPRVVYTLPSSDPIVTMAKDNRYDYAVSDSGNFYRWTASETDWDSNNKKELDPFHAIKGVVRVYAGLNHVGVICTLDMGLMQVMISRDAGSSLSNDSSQPSVETIPDDAPRLPMIAVPEFLDDLSEVVHTETDSREGDGLLHTYGKGVGGRLGHGEGYTKSEESIRNPKKVISLARMSVIHAAAGKDSTACVTDTGKLYTWGLNESGKLGHGSKNFGATVRPTRVSGLFTGKIIVKAAIGQSHMAAMTDEHKFYSWGSNTFGQLGLPTTHNVLSPTEVVPMREARIRDFGCGGWHTIVCSWTGWVYTCGKGWHGQLGQGDYESLTAQSKTLPYFKRIADGFGDQLVVKVYGGKETSAALSETGRVFTWGHGETYQLGHGRHDNESQPKEVEALSRVRIVDVALGEKHMLALNELGQPYSWGTGAQGQLGHGPLAIEEKLPRMLTICSRTQSKNFVETTRDIPWGSFYIMKDKEPGSTEEQEIEFTQPGKVCAVAACGNYSVFVLKRVANREEVLKYKEAVTRGDLSAKKMTEMTPIQELFACGSGKGGVLQTVSKESEFLPKYLPWGDGDNLLQNVVFVAAGESHVCVIERENPLPNVEFANKEVMLKEDIKSVQAKKQSSDNMEIVFEEDDEEQEEDHDKDPFATSRHNALYDFLLEIKQEKWAQKFREHDIDLETFSTLKDDQQLKDIGIDVLGARRRLLKEIKDPEPELRLPNGSRLQDKYMPMFYSFKNNDWYFLSWPPTDDSHRGAGRKKEANKIEGDKQNPFAEWLQRKATAKVFRSMVRYAEGKHFEILKDRANKRYEVDSEGIYSISTWGCGIYGRLGHGFGISYAIPTDVRTFPAQVRVVEVACGAEHTIARTFDGAVMSWGNGDKGQLGISENFHGIGTNQLSIPQGVPALKRFFILTISAGRWHNIALTSDRQVWVWGDGLFGQLGLDVNEGRGVPVQVKALDGRAVCKVLCGGWHSAAITETGKMMLWGKNSYGQLGFGDSKSTNYPKINQELRSQGKVRAAALGANHTLVVMVMNKVYAFGDNQFGQLGFGGGGRLWKIAKEIADLDKMNICQVAAGDQHSVALSVFGEVWSWGGSPYGQLGHGGITDISRPTPLLERHNIPPDVKSIACGNTFTAALSKNGSLYTWGQGESGELGHPEKVLLYAPTPVQEFHNVSQVACGHRHMAAVIFKPRRSLGGMDGGGLVGDNATTKGSQSGDGESVGRSSKHRSTVMMTPHKKHGVALTWGEDTCGQLGMRGLQSARSPTIMQLLLGHNIVHAAANSDCSAFVTDTGSVFMCGKGDEGRLGLGHLGPAPTPTEVRNLGILNRIVMVACGFGHTLALSDDRRVFAWGEGTWGNTGVTNSSECLEPIEIHSLTTKEVRSVHAGGFHSSAITADGNLYCWGKNTNGQLGIGTVTSAEESPQQVSSIIGIVKDVAMGRNHTAIIMMIAPPNILTFGLNGNGQLGQEDFQDRCDPTQVQSLDDRLIVSVGCGNAHTACVSQYGDVIVWGHGRNGQLGLLSGIDRDHETPVQIPQFCPNQVIKVVCGQESTAAITDEGEVYYCGLESAIGLAGAGARNQENPVLPKLVEGLVLSLESDPTKPSHICLALGTIHAIAVYQTNIFGGEP